MKNNLIHEAAEKLKLSCSDTDAKGLRLVRPQLKVTAIRGDIGISFLFQPKELMDIILRSTHRWNIPYDDFEPRYIGND